MRGEQAIFNLKIKKKSGLSINPDIHHSKVFSSGYIRQNGTVQRINLCIMFMKFENFQEKQKMCVHFKIKFE